MKKRSILTAICALLGTLTIASGCSALGGLLGGSSASESSVQVENPTSSEKEETSSTPDASEDPESSSTPDVSEDPESSSTPDVSEDPESSTPEDSEEPEVPTESALAILTEGEVFPYVDEAKAYLQAGAGADVADYYEMMDNPQAPIEIAWKWTATGAGKFLVEYGTEADYSDAVTVEAGARDRSIEVYNLYKATTYYVRISAFNRKGELVEKQEGEFYTTDLGPRVMNIDGICNVRDIGGYESSLGKTIQQGIAFRGGALKDKNSKLANGNWLELTEDGKKYMSEVLGIKGELDFRDENESGIKLKDGSLIPGAKLTYITAGGYQDPFKGNAGSGQKEVYRRIFSYFSNKDNYPLYMHCTAGADRTGSVVYILQAFLGVSELECAQGYEFTSFSIYGLRGESDPHNGTRYKEMKELLQAYPGENLQQKAENYLLSIGVTETEIYNIKAIFFGEETIEEEIPNALTVTAPTGEVYPYIENAKNYLLAGASANPADYYNQVKNPQTPIQVKWDYTASDASKFRVEYATKADYSDALVVETDATKRSVDLYNLYKATAYYVRVSVLDAWGNVVETDCGDFYTTDLGPRVMNVEGIYNVRDIGGHESSLGKTVQQGIAYRGGALTPAVGFNYDSNITEAGKKYMSEVMGVKGELDFRNTSESGIGYESVVPGVNLTYIALGGYTSPFYHGKESYRKLFSYLSDEKNYPLYYHCTGGADRTGTVTFLLQAFLGVSEEECIQDFAFTTFSVYGPRAAEGYQYWEEFNEMIALLKKYDGANLQEKTENYLLSIGVTETEIYNIKAIFFGEETKVDIHAPQTFRKGLDGDLVISVVGKKVPAKLYLGGIETPFTYVNGILTVTEAQLPALPNSKAECKVVFTDGIEVAFEINWKSMDIVRMDNVLTFDNDGKVVLTENKVLLTGSGVVGYGKTAIIRATSTTVEKTQGGFRMLIGSYGFECRGGELRPYTLDANGTMKEVARDTGMGLSATLLNNGATLYMSVEIVGETAVLTLSVEGNTTYDYTYVFAKRVANEISSENAKMGFWIRTDAVTSLTVYNETAWINR